MARAEWAQVGQRQLRPSGKVLPPLTSRLRAGPGTEVGHKGAVEL